jgi:SAM-dependent methyltransferase
VFLPPGTYPVTATLKLASGVRIVGAGPESTTITLEPESNCHVFTNDDYDKGNEGIELRGFTLEGNMRSQHRPPDHTALTFACGGYFKRVRGLVVDDVVAHGIRQTAFHFNHCSDVELHGLAADELGWSGVSTSGTDDIRLLAVVVTNAGLDVRHSGIHLDGGRGAYVDAVVDGCTGNGIMLDSKFSPMSDVVVRAVARRSLRGLSLSGDHENPLDNVCLSGGDYSENRECGLLVSNASNVFVVDATIASNGTAGIVVQGKSGSRHCVVAGCRISGSPQLVVERDGNKVAYVAATTKVSVSQTVEPLTATDGRPPPAPTSASPTAVPVLQRLRGRVARNRPAPQPSAATAAAPRAAATVATAAPPAAPGVSEDDAFEDTCNVCGEHHVFVRRNASLREGYRCPTCKASLRYRGQADAILRCYARDGATSISEIAREPAFRALHFWEPGVLGPFRAHFGPMPNYVVSDFWPDVRPGDERDGVRCEDLMALTFRDESFDLVVTSDIFEHVRKPDVGFAEVHRVLRPGGRHIFSIPVQEPMRAVTLERVDTSGDEDVYILEPRYHLGPNNSQHIVYNDFGRDLLDRLAGIGFDTDVIRFDAPNAEASRLLTFCSVKRSS